MDRQHIPVPAPSASSPDSPVVGFFHDSEDLLAPLNRELTLAGFKVVNFSLNQSGRNSTENDSSHPIDIFIWDGLFPHAGKLASVIRNLCPVNHEPIIAAAVKSSDPRAGITALDDGAALVIFIDLHPSLATSQLWNLLLARQRWAGMQTQEESPEADRKNAEFQRDMQEAGRLQRRILPPLSTDGGTLSRGPVDYDYLFMPCLEVGGDFIDIETLPGGRTLFYLADVAGHGIRSALVTIHIREFVRSLWRERPGLCASPLDALEQINAFLLELNSIEYASMAFCVYEPAKRLLRMATGAHHGPVAMISSSGEPRALSPRGKPLGVFENASFRVQNIPVNPGDILLLCSDGASDQRDPEGTVPGRGRIVEAAAQARILCGNDPQLSLMLAEMKGFLERWKGPDLEWDDDVTLALFRF